MTIIEAKKSLEEPLRFGDLTQIRAIRFLDQVEAFRKHYRTCSDCQQEICCPVWFAQIAVDGDVVTAAYPHTIIHFR